MSSFAIFNSMKMTFESFQKSLADGSVHLKQFRMRMLVTADWCASKNDF